MQNRTHAEKVAGTVSQRFGVEDGDISVRKATSNSEFPQVTDEEYVVQFLKEGTLDYNGLRDLMRLVENTGASNVFVGPDDGDGSTVTLV